MGDKTYIVCSIAVIIYTAKEGSSSIFTNVLRQKVAAAWVFIEEVGHIMNGTRDADQWTSFGLGLICACVSKRGAPSRWSLTALPINDWQVIIVRWPRELLLGLTQAF